MAYCDHSFVCDSGKEGFKRCVKCDSLLKVCSHCKGLMRKVRVKQYDYMPFEWQYQCYECLKYERE